MYPHRCLHFPNLAVRLNRLISRRTDSRLTDKTSHNPLVYSIHVQMYWHLDRMHSPLQLTRKTHTHIYNKQIKNWSKQNSFFPNTKAPPRIGQHLSQYGHNCSNDGCYSRSKIRSVLAALPRKMKFIITWAKRKTFLSGCFNLNNYKYGTRCYNAQLCGRLLVIPGYTYVNR